jgi:very-short-patch-repair endonuclease
VKQIYGLAKTLRKILSIQGGTPGDFCGQQFGGFKFRRQELVGNYVVKGAGF